MKKWILLLTMPGGSLFVLAEREECLALFPVQRGESTALKDVFAFDTKEAAQSWIDQTASMSEKGANLMEMVEPFLADELQ